MSDILMSFKLADTYHNPISERVAARIKEGELSFPRDWREFSLQQRVLFHGCLLGNGDDVFCESTSVD